MPITKDELRTLLLKEWKYPEKQVDGTTEKLLKMEPTILDAFEKWLVDREFTETPAFIGLNPKNLNETYPLKPPAVFLLLDWIRRAPRDATQALLHEYRRLPETGRKV
jgi:hypothetical protein